MTQYEHEPRKPGRRISDEETKEFWEKRHKMQAEQKQRQRQAEMEAAKLRMMLI